MTAIGAAPPKKLGRHLTVAIAETAFMSGLGYTLVNDSVSSWLAQMNATPTVIGVFALCALPYGLKWIWAPLLDRWHAPIIGRRRRRIGWLTTLGVLCAILLVAAGFAGPVDAVTLAPSERVPEEVAWVENHLDWFAGLTRGGLLGFALIVFALSFVSASLDVVVDAFRTDSLARGQLGKGASLYVSFFRVASLLGGAGTLFVASRYGWRIAFILAALAMLKAALGVLLAPEPTSSEPMSFRDAVIGPGRSFVAQWGSTTVALAVFVLLFRLPDLVGSRMVSPFLFQHLGFSLDEVGVIRQFLGFGFTIAGAALGGLVISRLGIAKCMLLFGVLQAASNLGYVWMDQVGKDRTVFIVAIAIESACNGMVGTVFVAFLMSICEHRYSAAQYAMLTGLMFLAASLVGSVSGPLLLVCSHLPGVLYGYSGFFITTIAMGVPGVLMVPWVTRRAASRPAAAVG